MSDPSAERAAGQTTVESAQRPVGWDKPVARMNAEEINTGTLSAKTTSVHRPAENSSRATRRPERVPIGTRNVLTYPPIPGYKTRVVNDVEDRIERFKAAGYEIVQSGELGLGDEACGIPGSVGSEVSKPVGAGRRGVLMKIREDWYAEDQAKKQADVLAKEQSLFPDAEAAGLTINMGKVRLDGLKINVTKGAGSR